MKALETDPWRTVLAGARWDGTAITVRNYADMVGRKDRAGIARLIHNRFSERYLDPVLKSSKPHGFSMLAVGCLMVEALESFRNGWVTTKVSGEGAFCWFFHAHDEFKELRPVAHEFYRAVRCGILHQAETTDNWRVNRGSPLFHEEHGLRRVSASEFLKRLRCVLDRYCADLVVAEWGSQDWVKTRRKLQAICRNCGLNSEDVSRLS